MVSSNAGNAGNSGNSGQGFGDDDDEPTDPTLVVRRGPAGSKTVLPPPRVGTNASAATMANSAQNPPPGVSENIRMPEMGILNSMMKDPTVNEIMVNDTRNIMIEKDGKMGFSGVAIGSIEELNRLARSIIDITGRVLSPEQPFVDVMLPDGSRANIITTPLTQNGPVITIRKFPTRRFSLDDLVQQEMLDRRSAQFLNACVVGKMNILVSGGTNSGKTTLLNAFAQLIPKSERIIAIEDTPELILTQANTVKLQTKPSTPTSAAINARDLVANSLRMRPDRILVGECRRGEAFDLLQAMNTGHGGSMSTIHANAPRDALARMETLCLLAGTDLPLIAVRKQLNSAMDLLIQVKRFRSGKRRVTAITEVTGIEGENITLQDIFLYETDARNSNNVDAGHFRCTGFVPTFLDKLAEHGVELPKTFFA